MPKKVIWQQKFNPIGGTSKPLYLATKEELDRLDTKISLLNNLFIAVGIVVVLGFIGVIVALGGILRDYWEGKENAYIQYSKNLENNNILMERLINKIKNDK